MIKTAATVPDLQAVELVETWHINQDNADEVLADLKNAGLTLSMLIPDLWASGKWGKGSFASKDEKARRDAVETTKRAPGRWASTTASSSPRSRRSRTG